MCGSFETDTNTESAPSTPATFDDVVKAVEKPKYTVSQALRAGARWLWNHPKQWKQGAYKVTAEYDAKTGEYVKIEPKCCAIGAVREAVTGGNRNSALEDAIANCAKKFIPPQINRYGDEFTGIGLISYNDSHATNVDQVVGMMNYLANKCAKDEGPEPKLFEGAAL